MTQTFLHLAAALSLTLCANARTWTRTDGKAVEAQVVKVHENRTVELRTANGRKFTVPFRTFTPSDMEHLDGLLFESRQANLHPVPWEKLNELFGIPVWQDANLWDDPTAGTAGRMNMRMESKTAFMENYRAYPLGTSMLLGQPVYTLALYGGAAHTDSLSFIFLNLGDMPQGTNVKQVKEQISVTGDQIHDRLLQVLGKPERDSLGSGDLREKVWRWDWNGHAIMLSIQDEKYTAMRIMPVERAENGGKISRISDDALKARMASCVERRSNGDVVVINIPMINQGPKGYCSPATWERYLRYVDIPADMYLLALAAGTGIGGGTYSDNIIDVTSNLISSYGRKLDKTAGKPSVSEIYKLIDKGLPVMWSFYSTPDFQRKTIQNTARRNGKEIEFKQNNSGQQEDTSSGGHICLIIGYNKTTGEIAISDSWGPKYKERWVPPEIMQKVSDRAVMNVIKW